MWSRRRPSVTVYTRRGCHLCEQAEAAAARLGRRARVEVVDIDADPDLQERYTVRVPVVAVDGREVAQFEVDERRLRQVVRQARRR